MRRPREPHAILFGLVVFFCLAEVSWWILFQYRESGRLEAAGQLLDNGDIPGAVLVLGGSPTESLADAASSRRTMFIAEGAAMGLLVLVGVVFFYAALVRERRLRHGQERFLCGATHELKTPVTTLRLGLETLADRRLSDDRRRGYVHDMLREVDRLEVGLTNLLTAAGLIQTRGTSRSSGDLAADVRSAADHFAPRFAAADIRLTVAGLDTCPIVRDPDAVRLVLHNLLDNALKYSERGDEVAVEVAKATDGAAVVRVRDSGLGIARDDLPHVFDRFYRGSDKDHIGGTGIGLALVEELVRAHGGSVTVHSDGPGRGSEFVVTLPHRGTPRAGPPAIASSAAADRGGAP